MDESPIQLDSLNGKWTPRGTMVICAWCGLPHKTEVDMLVLPDEKLVCHECANGAENAD